MKQLVLRYSCQILVCVSLFSLLLTGCDSKTASSQRTKNDAALVGTWILKTDVSSGGSETPVSQRLMKLYFNPDGSFKASYRGNASQNWIRAGQGGFAYIPPYLNLYWESGTLTTLLLRQAGPKRLLIHHGYDLVPLKDQEPDEIFVRQNAEKGPAHKQS
jgi:peptidoglycan hydrolase-like protein with peptidoglycan-binding domain